MQRKGAELFTAEYSDPNSPTKDVFYYLSENSVTYLCLTSAEADPGTIKAFVRRLKEDFVNKQGV